MCTRSERLPVQCIVWITWLVSLGLCSESPNFIYTPPAYMTGKKGEPITLRCQASGTPAPTLTWFKDGNRIQPSRRINIYDDVLQITSLEDGDVGRYKCMFTNPYGHATYTTTLVLEGGALITEPPRNLTVNNGESASFQCQGRASPDNITYTWYKDGININKMRRLRTKSRVDNVGTLFISSVGADDSGVYRCTVSNGLGAPMSAQAHLSVIFTPLVDKDRMPGNIHIPIGRTGILPCPVKGYPTVSHVLWAKTRGVIDLQSPRLEVNKEFSLLIHNVTLADSDWYTCTPYNEYGPGVQSDLITVAAVEPPYFTIQPNPMYKIDIHGSITIPCSAQSSRVTQPTIRWTKIHGPMPDSPRLRQHARGNLTINNVQKADGGSYECVASDGDIGSTARTELVVQNTTPLAPYNVTALFGHYSIQVSWTAGFNGGFPQKYNVLFREGRRGNGNWQVLPSDQTDYTIYGLIPKTEYELKVMSLNKLGNGMESEVVRGKTQGYTPGNLMDLPTKAGQVLYPTIIKPLGPAPTMPENFSVVHDLTDGILISWNKPERTPVPILYYRVQYKNGTETLWHTGTPVPANKTSTRFVPRVKDSSVIKYYIRVRSYGLLAYSDYTEAKIIYFPKKPEDSALSVEAKIGIGIASFFFAGLLIAVVVILCDLKPSRSKHNVDKNGTRAQYSIAPQNANGSSQWQSFYPYHGGRFAVNGEADNIYVIDSQRENALTNSSTERDGSMARHEQGWYFPRDGHPEQDLTRTYDSGSSDKPPPHGISYTANYSNYNGLLHGYYDARTGTQISPSVINYPHSGLEASDTTDGQTSYDTAARRRFRPPSNAKVESIPRSGAFSRNESHPIYANQVMVSSNTDPNWFTPHLYPQNSLNEHTSTMSPISLSYDREQEIVLKPSLPRHSSMKPSIQVPPDDVELEFDPNIRDISRNIPVDVSEYDFRNANEYPYTNGWVQSQTPTFNSRQSLQNHSNTFRQRGSEHPSRLRGYHTIAPHGVARVPVYPHHPVLVHHVMERGSSLSSSVNEMRTHYNRDRLLGTVERVRSTSSRSRRPGSFASLSSEQLSPQLNGYVHSPLPPPYQLTERYPELVSPVYYNNNNNRQPEINPPRRGNFQPPRNHSYLSTSPHYENSGLLTSTEYRAPAFARHDSGEPSNATSGLGSSWSQSKVEGNPCRSQPSWSRSPYEYDLSCESSPAVILPQFSTNNSRFFGLYAKPKYANHQPSQQTPTWNTRNPKTSYDPSFFLNDSDSTRYQPHQLTPQSMRKLTLAAPSDSVDENYEFDPILIDSEPQDFFHIHCADMPETVESGSSSSQHLRRPSLYAEKPTPSLASSSQRFNRLRDEYNTFKERQASNRQRMTLSRLESDIL